MTLEDKITRLIQLQNEVFLMHRYARADAALDAEAAALAAEIAAVDTDGSIARRLRNEAAAFIAEELSQHPPGTIDPYQDITPAPADESPPRSRSELLALDPEDLYFIIGEALEVKAAEGLPLAAQEAVVYVLFRFDDEVQNGGAEQFFANAPEMSADCVADALAAVGAKKYAALFSQLLPDAHDSAALEQFDAGYYKHYERTPLSRFVGKYIRKHIDTFTC